MQSLFNVRGRIALIRGLMLTLGLCLSFVLFAWSNPVQAKPGSMVSLSAQSALQLDLQNRSQDTVKILAIGNSFSVDALENYLYDLASAAGYKIIIGNLAIASGSLAQHVHNAEEDLNPYIYTRIDANGQKRTTFNNAIAPILKSENWDYVSLQQVSSNSGNYKSFIKPLPVLSQYVKTRVPNSKAKIILHQTWAYAASAKHPGFAAYQNNQQTMYKAIVRTYNRAKKRIHAAFIVPAGTAIQNARTSFVGDHMNKDGSHLEQTYARYVVACTWFEKLFGVSVLGNPFKPATISNYYKEMAQHAAHYAVLKPGKVTVLKQYQQQEPQTALP